ncbi:hypothetical protein ACOMHN_025321 [Nucella lapillus]
MVDYPMFYKSVNVKEFIYCTCSKFIRCEWGDADSYLEGAKGVPLPTLQVIFSQELSSTRSYLQPSYLQPKVVFSQQLSPN